MSQPETRLAAEVRVVDKSGVQAVARAQPTGPGVPAQAAIVLPSGDQIVVPLAVLVPQADGSYVAPFDFAEAQRAQTPGRDGLNDGAVIVPVLAERLVVSTEPRETGSVRLTKQVHERQVVVDEPLQREEVRVERVAIDRVVASPPPVRYEGDTMIVPVLEEVVVVEKRLVLREEIRVTRRAVGYHAPQTVVLRREEATVERTDADVAAASRAGAEPVTPR